MTDTALFSETLGAPSSRRDAFRAAGRHTVRVRLLRRGIAVATALGLAALIVFVFFNPFRAVIPSVSIESLGLDGTKVTMDQPKLAGFKTDGRPYTLVAKTAVQDVREPNVLELHDMDAHMTLGDKSVVHVESSLGTYDSSSETMTFDHDVHLTTDNGMDARIRSAFVDFRLGVLDTNEAVTVVMSNGTVHADTMHVGDNGKEVSFEGHVHSIMLPPAAAARTAGSLKGSAP